MPSPPTWHFISIFPRSFHIWHCAISVKCEMNVEMCSVAPPFSSSHCILETNKVTIAAGGDLLPSCGYWKQNRCIEWVSVDFCQIYKREGYKMSTFWVDSSWRQKGAVCNSFVAHYARHAIASLRLQIDSKKYFHATPSSVAIICEAIFRNVSSTSCLLNRCAEAAICIFI